MLREVREQGRQLGERLDLMERRLAERERSWDTRYAYVYNESRDANAFARFLNMRATKLEDELRPLRALGTNEEIREFPRTVAAMNAVPSARLNEILRLLGEPIEGDVAQRRRRLKLFTGVLVQAV
ncbi:hypothetical protein CIB48_g2926 [Xylaria polymorpha]|nr:hypothetical protein CIB48_g2926 [Xylaria polymorpha]